MSIRKIDMLVTLQLSRWQKANRDTDTTADERKTQNIKDGHVKDDADADDDVDNDDDKNNVSINRASKLERATKIGRIDVCVGKLFGTISQKTQTQTTYGKRQRQRPPTHQ